MSILNDTYFAAWQQLNNGSVLGAAAATYEAALPGYWVYLVILLVMASLIWIKTQNIGVFVFGIAAMSDLLIYLGKFPAGLHYLAYGVMAMGIAMSFILFFTERTRG